MFGSQEHRVFNYKPIFYDPEKEELKKKFGEVDGSVDKEMSGEDYVPGSRIRGSMRDGGYWASRRTTGKAHNIIGIVGLILVMVILIYIAKFYMML